ncbi:MAG: hypothetical protein IPF96_13710 [Rhodobacter sp.]|nr:hypothetical protein [Rhodobacter sp.]
MTACDPLIDDPFLFPCRPANRPALQRIGYRIGEYPDMVEAMLRSIDGEVALAGWTHRGADDPGIALLESLAVVGDILTFYQERYANETFLRTAEWRESVAGLVRLMGYRLSPGLGGAARLSVELKPAAGKIVVPAGYPFKADLDGQDQSVEFQTDADLTAWPHLSAFNLFRPRSYAASVAAGTDTLEVERAGSSTALAAIASLALKKGDRILLVPDAPAWVSNPNAGFSAQDPGQVLKVKDVRTVHDRTLVTFETTIDRSWSLPLVAYRLGRTWRHFGHAAPPKHTVPTPTSGTVTGASNLTTGFVRHIYAGHACANTSMAMNLPAEVIPLDQEVQDLVPGVRIAVETRVQLGGVMQPCILVRRIAALRATAMTFGPQTGASTLVTMENGLLSHSQSTGQEADIRDFRIHEITSQRIRFRPLATVSGGGFASGTETLTFYGTRKEALTLVDRPLMLKHDDGRWVEMSCVNEATDFPWGTTDPKMWLLSFDAPPSPFQRADFDEEVPKVTVHGNLVTASQGKAVPMVTLGNGDARAVFQTFALPKPVTHLLHPGDDPAEVPELTVLVNGRAAERVSSLYGQAADRLVYVLRQDDAGGFHVQFGDGKTGARLPTGRGNVTATFRNRRGCAGGAESRSHAKRGHPDRGRGEASSSRRGRRRRRSGNRRQRQAGGAGPGSGPGPDRQPGGLRDRASGNSRRRTGARGLGPAGRHAGRGVAGAAAKRAGKRICRGARRDPRLPALSRVKPLCAGGAAGAAAPGVPGPALCFRPGPARRNSRRSDHAAAGTDGPSGRRPRWRLCAGVAADRRDGICQPHRGTGSGGAGRALGAGGRVWQTGRNACGQSARGSASARRPAPATCPGQATGGRAFATAFGASDAGLGAA